MKGVGYSRGLNTYAKRLTDKNDREDTSKRLVDEELEKENYHVTYQNRRKSASAALAES